MSCAYQKQFAEKCLRSVARTYMSTVSVDRENLLSHIYLSAPFGRHEASEASFFVRVKNASFLHYCVFSGAGAKCTSATNSA